MSKVIEFYGLPGSGKTSVSNLLQTKLIEKEIDVQTFDDVFRKYRTNNFLFKVFTFIKLFFVRYKFVINTIIYSFSYGISLDILKRIKISILHDYLIYSFCQKKQNTILILEEGYIQNILSYAYSKHLIVNKSLYRLINLLNKKNIKLHFVYSKLDIPSAIERIIQRKNNNKRFNPSNIITLENRLKLRQKSENEINKIINNKILCKLNMLETIENNANKLFIKVMELIK
jgi:hypothetical protein